MSGIVVKPMLAYPADPGALATLMEDEGWALQQKLDGTRSMPHVEDGSVEFLSRTGRPMNVDPAVRSGFDGLPAGRWVFDGEYMDKRLWLFDLVEAPNGMVDRRSPWRERQQTLQALMGLLGDPEAAPVVPATTDSGEKAQMAERLAAARAEGFMLRNVDSLYVEKRSRSLLKVKYRADVDAIVSKITPDKESVSLSMWDGDTLREVGECGCDKSLLRIGDVVTLTILYVTEGGRLYQPTRLRKRDDLAPQECTVQQLAEYRTSRAVLR